MIGILLWVLSGVSLLYLFYSITLIDEGLDRPFEVLGKVVRRLVLVLASSMLAIFWTWG